jgi:hypothetical protein
MVIAHGDFSEFAKYDILGLSQLHKVPINYDRSLG